MVLTQWMVLAHSRTLRARWGGRRAENNAISLGKARAVVGDQRDPRLFEYFELVQELSATYHAVELVEADIDGDSQCCSRPTLPSANCAAAFADPVVCLWQLQGHIYKSSSKVRVWMITSTCTLRCCVIAIVGTRYCPLPPSAAQPVVGDSSNTCRGARIPDLTRADCLTLHCLTAYCELHLIKLA